VHQTGRTDIARTAITETAGYSAEETAAISARWVTRGRGRAVLLNPMPADERDQRSRFEGAGTWRSLEDTLAVSDVSPKAIYQSAAALDFKAVKEKTLDNGLKVVVYQHGAIPYVRANLVALGGGVPIMMGDAPLGAVGVSGAVGGQERDTACAQMGIDAIADQLD